MASMAINESDMSMPRMRIGQLRGNEAIQVVSGRIDTLLCILKHRPEMV